MDMIKTDCKQHVDESTSQLKAGGLKITAARLSLLDLFKHAKKPLSVKEIAVKLKTSDVDPVTLYRNVESLENLGIIRQLRLQDRQAHYEIADNHHHHLVCKICGKIVDVEGCKISVADKNFLKKNGFAKMTGHSLEFFGICNTCAKK